MSTLKQVVLTLCLASFSAGVLLHLFPDAAAKRSMKAVAGLYILCAVLGGVQDGSFFLQEAQHELMALEGALQSEIESSTEGAFENTLLTQATQSLESQYNAYLIEQGYEATIAITLVQGENSMTAQSVCITSAAPLLPEEENALTGYFTQVLAMQEICFVSGEGALE